MALWAVFTTRDSSPSSSLYFDNNLTNNPNQLDFKPAHAFISNCNKYAKTFILFYITLIFCMCSIIDLLLRPFK